MEPIHDDFRFAIPAEAHHNWDNRVTSNVTRKVTAKVSDPYRR